MRPCHNVLMITRILLLPLGLALLAGCDHKDDTAPDGQDTGHAADDSGEPDSALPTETQCDEAAARLGYTACVHLVPDDDTFEAVTVAAGTIDQLRVGKYLVPATEDARLPPVFIDVNHFPLHYDFLTQAFPDLFSGLSTEGYETLVLYPATREFYGGTLSLYMSDEGFYYGFTVWDDPADDTSTVTQADITSAWEQLSARFQIGELSWVPNSSAQTQAALSWGDTPFNIEGIGDQVDYEVYNEGDAYGTLRLYTLDELDAATANADFGYQEILGIEEAPPDLERVVSGIITGSRQGALSHLSVRSSTRGTPNCYISGVLDELAEWEGRLVHFECGATDWSVEEATAEQAEAWWESIRPDPVEVCEPNVDETALPGLLELATDTLEERDAGKCTYGTKGTNLATLYQRIDPTWQIDGFLIPMHYYRDFIDNTTWVVDLGDGAGEVEHSFADTLEAWHADPEFLTDAGLRRDRLGDLRDAMEDAEIDPELTTLLSDRIVEVFGSDEVMVRLRSSSNAEDSLTFSGAGLYESESVCVADELDGDEDGPSRCDAAKEDEQTLRHAITEVWASLWKMEAWDERDWYSIDQTSVAMGLLCSTRSNDEQANAVAFSGNPVVADDDRYLVNAQEGEIEVVSTDPGIVPEDVLITVEDGVVTEITRVSGSSEVEGGEVLTDAELTELAEVLYEASLVFPVDDEIPEGHDLLWDTEWKVDATGQLRIKQIRPYLR